MFIDNGFDEWETVTYLKGHELIDIGFDAEECLIILITINNNAKEHGRQEIFNEELIQNIVKLAKQQDEIKWLKAKEEE